MDAFSFFFAIGSYMSAILLFFSVAFYFYAALREIKVEPLVSRSESVRKLYYLGNKRKDFSMSYKILRGERQ
jgi:hypothetical protein